MLLDNFDEAASLGQAACRTSLEFPRPGRLGRLHDHFQDLAEPEITALKEIMLELIPAPADPGLQVGLVMLRRMVLNTIFLAEGVEAGGPGHQDLVDLLTFGWLQMEQDILDLRF